MGEDRLAYADKGIDHRPGKGKDRSIPEAIKAD
jgi:hypothetical protein